jgi:hypothetical protein
MTTLTTEDLESELADRRTHAIHDSVVLAGVASVKNELVDWPDLNLLRLRRLQHPGISRHALQAGVVFQL